MFFTLPGFCGAEGRKGRIPGVLSLGSPRFAMIPALSPASLRNMEQDHGIDQRIDYKIMEQAKEALENKTPVSLKMPINNLDRTTGTILSYNISTK